MRETRSHQTLTGYDSAGFLGSDTCNYQPQIYAEHPWFRESKEILINLLYITAFFFPLLNRGNCTGECTHVLMWKCKNAFSYNGSVILEATYQISPLHHTSTGTQISRSEVWRKGSGWGFCSYVVTARARKTYLPLPGSLKA